MKIPETPLIFSSPSVTRVASVLSKKHTNLIRGVIIMISIYVRFILSYYKYIFHSYTQIHKRTRTTKISALNFQKGYVALFFLRFIKNVRNCMEKSDIISI